MKRLCIIIVVACLIIFGENVFSQNESEVLFEPYLGFSMPYPVEIPEITVGRKDRRKISFSDTLIILMLDKKGKVKSVGNSPVLPESLTLIEKELKKIRFEFSEGKPLPEPISVPVNLKSKNTINGKIIESKFPFAKNANGKIESDIRMIEPFFKANHITLPYVKNIPAMTFRNGSREKDGRYLVITALIKLDENGQLVSLDFPYPNMSGNKHSVFAALINAEFQPVIIQEEADTSEFLITFRVFDNIVWPFSPTQPDDSTKPKSEAKKWFMTRYFNSEDIRLHPIPRNFPEGFRSPSSYSKKSKGNATGIIFIDSLGSTIGFSLNGIGKRKREDNLFEIARKFTWYPAMNCLGQSDSFNGKAKFTIERDKRVVCNAEWLN